VACSELGSTRFSSKPTGILKGRANVMRLFRHARGESRQPVLAIGLSGVDAGQLHAGRSGTRMLPDPSAIRLIAAGSIRLGESSGVVLGVPPSTSVDRAEGRWKRPNLDYRSEDHGGQSFSLVVRRVRRGRFRQLPDETVRSPIRVASVGAEIGAIASCHLCGASALLRAAM